MSSNEQLQIEATRVRDSGVLGETRLRQLFDYLMEKTLAGESTKEIVIAMDVFGKGADFNVGDDALVRVYMHKLRKALSAFYDSAAVSGGYSIQLPKGDYRLHLQAPLTAEPTPGPEIEVRQPLQPRPLWPLIAACSVLAAIVALLLVRGPGQDTQDTLVAVHHSPVWSELLADGRPITIALGDYYLVGETDPSNRVARLIREFAINSQGDLDRYVMQHPNDPRHLVDVGFRYLPTSSANALRRVMAVLATADRRISVRMMSDLPVSAFKSSDVIYIGFVSGMGMVQDMTFHESRLRVGDSYDELVDTITGRSYVSQEVSQVQDEGQPSGRGTIYHDYGMFAKLRGPAGNAIIIIAGTRDEGVEQTSEVLTNAAELAAIATRVDPGKSFEGLLEVSAVEGIGMTNRLLLVAPRGDSRVAADANGAFD